MNCLTTFGVTQGKKGKRAEKGASKPAAQRLNHSLDIIGAFSKLKMSVPLTSDQVGNMSSSHARNYFDCFYILL